MLYVLMNPELEEKSIQKEKLPVIYLELKST